jgi:hypothetical protein
VRWPKAHSFDLPRFGQLVRGQSKNCLGIFTLTPNSKKIPKPLRHRTYSSKKQPEIGKTRVNDSIVISSKLLGMKIQ